jgi:hypothetical protein
MSHRNEDAKKSYSQLYSVVTTFRLARSHLYDKLTVSSSGKHFGIEVK